MHQNIIVENLVRFYFKMERILEVVMGYEHFYGVKL